MSNKNKKYWIIIFIALGFSFILLFPYLVGYHWEGFNASIDSWDKLSNFLAPLSAIIGVISLIVIYRTLRLNIETLESNNMMIQEMKMQRETSVKPNLILESNSKSIQWNNEFEDYFYDNNLFTASFFKIVNVGTESAINLEIKVFLIQEEVERVLSTLTNYKLKYKNSEMREKFNMLIKPLIDDFNLNIISEKSDNCRIINLSPMDIGSYIKSDESKEVRIFGLDELLKVVAIVNRIDGLYISLPTVNISVKYTSIIGTPYEIDFKFKPSNSYTDSDPNVFINYYNRFIEEKKAIPDNLKKIHLTSIHFEEKKV